MVLSGGFFVVVSVGLMLVALPFFWVMVHLWRLSFGGRSTVFLSAAAVVGLGVAIFWSEPIAGTDSFEENAVLFLAGWGILFYLVLGIAGIVAMLKRIFRRKTPDLNQDERVTRDSP